MFNRKFSKMNDQEFARYLNHAQNCNFGSWVNDFKKFFTDYPAHDLIAASDEGITALLCVVAIGNMEFLEIILNLSDVNVNAPTPKTRQTPLMMATSRNQYDAVVRLLKFPGIDVNASDSENNTAAIMALAANSDQIAIALIQDHRLSINFSNNTGNTALHFAAKFGCTAGAIALIKKGADATLVNSEGDTPLIVAAKKKMAMQALLMLFSLSMALTLPLSIQKAIQLHGMQNKATIKD